jgi:2-polyprenyl-3-methyl-5-hydroxy-6-metoxy-1,4-benzoquinol methylase
MNKQERYNQKTDVYTKELNKPIIEQVTKGAKVLDVGCGNGRMGEYLIKNNQNKVTGIDISQPAIDQAKKVLSEAYCLDLEKDAMPFSEKSFEIIICGDILEHLFDPLSILKILSKYLKDDGFFLLSIPNVANIFIRLSLLKGNFNYQESGILDETHLRFFTLETIKKMLEQAGLKIVTLQGTRTGYGEEIGSFQKAVHRALFYNPLEAFLRKHWLIKLLSTQFIIKAKVK